MNNDAVNVRQIDLRSAFPSLRIVDSLSLTLNPHTLLLSCVCVILLSVSQDTLGTVSSDANDVLTQLGDDLYAIAIRGFSAGGMLWLSIIARMLVLNFFSAAVARIASERFCRGSNSGIVSAIRRAFKSRRALTVSFGLTALLLMILLTMLRFGQAITSFFASDQGANAATSLPALVAGVLFVILSVVVLVAWGLSTTSITVDNCEGAEALSRGISCVLSRPIRTFLLLVVILVIATGMTMLSEFLLDAAFRLHNSRREAGISPIRNEASIALSWWAGQTMKINMLMTGLPSVYLLIRHAEDGVSLKEIQS